MRKLLFISSIFMILNLSYAQEVNYSAIDSLKSEILKLNVEVNEIKQNLELSKSRFKKSIAVATLGYAITIAGGLMLGRSNDDLGKVLLVSGGVIGTTGTFMMVNSFNKLSPPRKSISIKP